MKHYIIAGTEAIHALKNEDWKALKEILEDEDQADTIYTYEYREDNLNVLFGFLMLHSEYRELNSREVEQTQKFFEV